MDGRWGSIGIALGVALGAAGPTRAQDRSDLPELIVLSIADTTGERRLEAPMATPDSEDSWMIEEGFSLPFATFRRVEVEVPHQERPDQPLELLLEFLCQGEQDPERRILVECTVRDPGGQVLHQTFRLVEDQRLHSGERQFGGRRGWVSPMNTVRFEVPREAFRLERIEFRLRSMTAEEWYHFPIRPSRHGLEMTRLDRDGAFTLTFGYPPEPVWDTARLHCVVQLFEVDAQGEQVGHEVRSFARPGEDGRFRAAFRLDPAHADTSHVQLVFFRRPEDPEAFVDARFRGKEGDARFGGGQWSQTGYVLIHVPFADD